MHILTTALLKKAEGERKYVARPGIEPGTPDLRVRSPTDCATRPAAGEVNANTQCIYPLTVKANAIAWLCGQGIATLSLSKIFLKHVVIYQENLYGER